MREIDDIEFESFKPVWWAPEVHSQTVFASFSQIKNPDTEYFAISTPDDDFLEVEVIDLENENPVVALFHGLEGCSRRHYIQNLIYDLKEAGYSSVALNFRGCGEKLNRRRRMYHSGETEDYKTLFSWIEKQFSNREIYAVGFSLGGNALIKSLGELGENHPVKKAAAVSPPYDLGKGSIRMNQGFNKVYQHRFLKTLEEKAKAKKEQYPDFPVYRGSSVYEFDDQVTAPVHGFEGADDYYQKCSSNRFYSEVKKPLLIIHSKQDSLCPLEYADFNAIEKNKNIRTLFTEKGGHVGFISKKRGWLNRTIIKWLNS